VKALVLALVLALVALPGCPRPVPSGDDVVQIVHDCAAPQVSPAIGALLTELRPLLAFKAPDWKRIYAEAKLHGAIIGGCTIAQLVQMFLGNRAAPPEEAASWDAQRALEQFRLDEAGGASFEAVVDGRRVRL
jgi:hypothetical protein